MKYIIALDQGTTSSRAILFDERMNLVIKENREFRQIYPQAGWVEHDPSDIISTILEVMETAIEKSKIDPADIVALGITNQRETVVVWDKNTGKPVYNAIVWQCRRTADRCEELHQTGMAEMIKQKTGLLPDAYFTASKIEWILDHVDGARTQAENGSLLAGTVDTFLMWHLSGGQIHATDYSNASRTMLFNIRTLDWDADLLQLFRIPKQMLPAVLPSSGVFGKTSTAVCGYEIPIASAAGDQQAALFGQACFQAGDAKNTYGTGCFMLMNTGEKPVFSQCGLLTTIAWGIGGKITYALEGSIFIAGAAIQWLRDELGMIKKASECDELAESVQDTNGAYFVPAFVGLGTPYWDMYARGTIIGLTRGVNKAHIARAALEAIAYQSYDVLKCMERDAGCKVSRLKVDGGASVSNVMMQFQADLLGVPVARPQIVETTAMGAAYLAGLGTGVWSSVDEISASWKTDRIFNASMPPQEVERRYNGWTQAVKRALGWARDVEGEK